MGRLDGKIALITGAASGMGVEHSRLFVEDGAQVVLADILTEPGETLAAELGAAAMFVELDVTNPEMWAAAVTAAEDAFGPVNVLINNAGYIGPVAKLADIDIAEYYKLIDIDQNGTFLGMRAVIPGMVKGGGGSIVNVASIAAFVHEPVFPNGAYTAAKFGVRGLTKAAAVEYGPDGIRVNTVCPGGTLTPMMLQALTPEMREASAATVPIRRMAQPREISQVVRFLASDESSFVTGADYLVDGGETID